MTTVFKYVKANNGVDTTASYPYKGVVAAKCGFNSANVGATATGYVRLPVSEASLQTAVATIGPVSVAIDASQPSFQQYKSGIYYDPLCSSTELDHGVSTLEMGDIHC